MNRISHIWCVVMLGYNKGEHHIMNGWIIHKKELGENFEVSRLVEELKNEILKFELLIHKM